MTAVSGLTPARRDAVAAFVALALLAGPVWTSAFHLGETGYRYERIEVTTGEDRPVKFADGSERPSYVTVSERIGCSDWFEGRTCAFERHLSEGATVPTGVHTGRNGSAISTPFEDDYDYVVVDDEVFRATYTTNGSAGEEEQGSYRVYLSLEPVSPETALENVSIDAAKYPDRVPDPALNAARTGSAVADHRIEVPEELILTDDGRYYRVYLAEEVEPSTGEQLVDVWLTYFTPVVGLLWLLLLRRRVEVNYVGERNDGWSRRR